MTSAPKMADALRSIAVEMEERVSELEALNRLVEAELEAFAQRSPSREVRLEAPDSLPLVLVNPTYYRQVVGNLVSNADKYSPQGMPVVVASSVDGDGVMVEVTDSGDGVPPEELDQIFDTFFRSEKTSGKAPGQGLGLTVCRKLVEAQGGKIWARNNPGGGFSVGFSFPVMALVEEEPVGV